MKANIPRPTGGMPSNMNELMRRAQAMQEEMTKAQEELAEKDYTATVGGGMVTVTVTGKHRIKALDIKPEAVDPEDIEMLVDLITGAVNEAVSRAEKDSEQTLSAISGGMPQIG